MEPTTEGSVPDPDSDCEAPQGTWFYNQGRSCYTVQLNEDEGELCFYQQMASGNVLRGVLGPPPEPAPGDGGGAGGAAAQEEPPWTWEALLSNQARIRLRREGPLMVSSYWRPSADCWTLPQRSDRRQRLTEPERAAYRAYRLCHLLSNEPVECGSTSRPLGRCRQCPRCAGWTGRELRPERRELFAAAAEFADGEAPQDIREARGKELHALADPVPNFDGVRFEFPKNPWESQHRTESTLPCGRCGCPEKAHEDVTRKCGRFLQRDGTFRTNIPLAALWWTQTEMALWSDTGGLFKPKALSLPVVRQKNAAARKGGGCVVSVICPTTSSRRCFHPFLWSCFNSQTISSRELVIIDTCEDGPSPFFEEKASLDDRVIYKYYNVPPWQWSIGVKRNLACYFASGKAIAHFDDDDLYAPIYLEEMLKCLKDPKEAFVLHSQAKLGQNHYLNMLAGLGFGKDYSRLPPPVEAGVAGGQWLDEDIIKSTLGSAGAALAKLSCWHTFSIVKQGWGSFDAIGSDDEPLMDVSNSLYGWGFSMVYLRTVWEVCPFLHMNLGEDFDFAKSIRNLNFPVILVPDRRGICAHTHHADNTAGGQQFFDYGTTSSLLYSPMGGMITGYTHAVKALQSFQEQAVEEGKSRRDADGKLRDITAANGKVESPTTQRDALRDAAGETKPASETKPAEEEAKPKLQPQRSSSSFKRTEPAPPPPPPPCRFSIVSSADGYRSKEDMSWDGNCFRYSGALTVVGSKVQLLKNGHREAVLYPSVADADLNTAHYIRGPDGRGHGCYWRLADPAGAAASVEGTRCEVVLNCPEGCPLSLGWSCGTEVARPDAGQAAASKPAPGGALGQWRLMWELQGRQQAGAAFFLAEAEGGQQVTVKCPASLPEMQHLAAMRCVSGVPSFFGCGGGSAASGGDAFIATQSLGDTLEELLARCDHDGNGGRIPWAAAQCLGRMLLTTLKGVHSRGLVLGSLSPHSVCVEAQGTQAFVTDFSQSRPFWTEASGEFSGVNSECDSIRAGFSDDRSPADDLEALGWLLWRCVVGPLPWSRLAASLGSKTGDERRGLCERMAKAKRQVFRAGSSAFGKRYNHFPVELEAYLRCVRGINSLGRLEAAKYSELHKFLEAKDSQSAWAKVVAGEQPDCYLADEGMVVWRAAGTSSSLEAEALPGSDAFTVAGTGRTELLNGGRWAEVEHLWSPGLPRQLLEQEGWVLVADWAGTALELRHPGRAATAADGDAADRAEADLLTSVLGPLAPVGEGGREKEAGNSDAEEEEADERERERLMMEIAATAARQYVKATAHHQ